MWRNKGRFPIRGAIVLICCLLLMSLAPVTVSLSANGQWTQLPLNEGDIHSLAIDPSNPQTLYAGTNVNGVWKSSDGGANWIASSTGLTDSSVPFLAIDPSNPQTLYAGTYSGGVCKSTNGGSSWIASSNGLTNNWVMSIAIDPSNPQTLYAGTAGGGVCKSTNGGAVWVDSSNGLTSNYVTCLAIDPSNPQILYAGSDDTGTGVFKSSDGGASWVVSSSGLAYNFVRSLAIDPNNSQILYAGNAGGVCKSTNGGAVWVASSSAPYEMTGSWVESLAIDPSNSQVLYAGTHGAGVFNSNDGGASWVASSTGLTDFYMYVRSLAIDPSNPQTLYAGTAVGVFKWTPGSTSSPTPTPSASPSPSPSPTSSPSPSPSPSPTTPPGSFSDVPPGYWAQDEIMSLVTAGVINGYPDGTFKPENPVTRAEFAKMALLSLGYALEFPTSPSFPDLDPTAWYYGYVEGAVRNGLVQGYPDGTFQPQGNITMAEILTVIMRAKGRTPVDPLVPTPIILLRDRDDSLRPITASDWFFQIVGSAENWGLLRFPEKVQIAQPGSGLDEYEFRFNSPASRAQTAVFLWR